MNTKIYNTIKKTLGFAFCAFILSSCTDNFEEMNREKGEPTDEEIMEGNYKLGAFFPQMLNYAYPSQENAYQMGENLIGDPYGRYLSIANNGFVNNFSIFNAPDGWIDSPFNDAFTKVISGWMLVANMSKDVEGRHHLYEWAQIVRITSMQRITDLYGPIPYTKVLEGGLGVSYDSQEEAYKTMLNDLDEAIDYLTKFVAENPTYDAMKKFDKVYNGDFKLWVKYANSLKLRMAIRIVYADEALAKKKALEAINHPIGVITQNGENTNNAYPQSPIWVIATSWGDSRACADIITYMNGYKDPRTEKYFTMRIKDKEDPNILPDYHGLRTGISMPSKGWAGKYSSANMGQTDPTLWLPASEVAFLKAEAALRGWEVGGSAESFYEQAVKLSFDQWGASGADTYLADATSVPADYVNPADEFNEVNLSAPIKSKITIKWDDAAGFEKKLERLITQKWIAMYPLGQEAWSDQRRTGYPYFMPTTVNSSTEPSLTINLASRIPFSPNEKINNTSNYNKAVELLGGADKYGTKLWWDKNANKPIWN